MHGSLNWFYSGADSFYGEPVYDLPLLAWGQDIPEGYAERLGEFVRLNVPDKVPLVLPPATDKSLWLNNEILRGQWLTLGDRLRMADRVIAVGYSLPQTDTLTYFLLATTCIDREVVLVNTNQQTANHYEALLPCASVDRTYVDQDAVHRFAGSLRSDQVVRSLLYKLAHLMGDVQFVHHGRIGKRLANRP